MSSALQRRTGTHTHTLITCFAPHVVLLPSKASWCNGNTGASSHCLSPSKTCGRGHTSASINSGSAGAASSRAVAERPVVGSLPEHLQKAPLGHLDEHHLFLVPTLTQMTTKRCHTRPLFRAQIQILTLRRCRLALSPQWGQSLTTLPSPRHADSHEPLHNLRLLSQ